MSTLLKYLLSAKEQLANCNYLVMGNEAADLDSMVASVAYGYLLQMLHPTRTVVPLIPVRRQEFYLRPEAVYLFGLVGISSENLIFSDDVELKDLFSRSSRSIVLVDHNVLPPSLDQYSEQVCTVLDHHRDEGLYQNADPRIIQPVGSSCSLVAHEYMRQGAAIESELACLLLGPVVLDTVNLNSKAGKTSAIDRTAYAMLAPFCGHRSDGLFKRLYTERFNVSSFTGRDLLRRDYKEYGYKSCRWAIAVVPQEMPEVVHRKGKGGLPVHSFARDRCLKFLLIMFFGNGLDFRRQLMVHWSDVEGQRQLFDFLQDSGLDLSLISSKDMGGLLCQDVRCYHQGNRSLSRKAIQPLVADFLNVFPV